MRLLVCNFQMSFRETRLSHDLAIFGRSEDTFKLSFDVQLSAVRSKKLFFLLFPQYINSKM